MDSGGRKKQVRSGLSRYFKQRDRAAEEVDLTFPSLDESAG